MREEVVMVLPIIDEEKRRASMVRCPRFEECESCLCPLDPYIKQKVRVPDTPLCYWYIKATRLRTFDGMPLCVVDKLPIYIVHLVQHDLAGPREMKLPRSRLRAFILRILFPPVRGEGRG